VSIPRFAVWRLAAGPALRNVAIQLGDFRTGLLNGDIGEPADPFAVGPALRLVPLVEIKRPLARAGDTERQAGAVTS